MSKQQKAQYNVQQDSLGQIAEEISDRKLELASGGLRHEVGHNIQIKRPGNNAADGSASVNDDLPPHGFSIDPNGQR